MADLPDSCIRHIYVSPGHNFKGRHGLTALSHHENEVQEVECVAGKGLVGDRFFGFKDEFKGQITFFDLRVYQELCETFHVTDKEPGVFRRNVILDGVDLSDLIGKEFVLQGITFFGMEECSPCYWMNQVFAEGTEDALRARGGLRARILSNGVLAVSAQ